MRLDHDFFCLGPSNNVKVKKEKAPVSNLQENKDPNEDEEMGVSYPVDISNYSKWST